MGRKAGDNINRNDIRKKIDDYFESRYGVLLDKNNAPALDANGEPIRGVVRPPTLSGLALALGLDDRDKLTSFTSNKAILSDVRRAVLRVEEYAEERLFAKDGNTAGIKLFLAVNFRRWAESGEGAAPEELPEEYAGWAE